MTDPLPWISLAFAFVTFALLVPLYGKVFFSTHQREYVTLEEHLALRKQMGLDPQAADEEAKQIADPIVKKMFGDVPEEYRELTSVPFRRRGERKPRHGFDMEAAAEELQIKGGTALDD